MVNFAQFTLGYIGVEEKDTAKAETELTKTLQTDPTNAQASYMLATVLLAQQKDHPEQMPLALFEYARAASYDGPGALDANRSASHRGFLTKAYTTYHGSAKGLDQVEDAREGQCAATGRFQDQEHSRYSQGRRREAAKSRRRKSDAGLLDHDERGADIGGFCGLRQILGRDERCRTSAEGKRSVLASSKAS